MKKSEIQTKIDMLKMDYIRIQGDMDKLESVGGRTEALEKQLVKMEEELSELRKQLDSAEE